MADLDLPTLERPEGIEDESRVERSHSGVLAKSQDCASEHSPGSSVALVFAKTIDKAPLARSPTITPIFTTAQEDHSGEGQSDDPRGTAAMALAVLSSGVGIQGVSLFDRTGQDRLTASPREGEEEVPGENRTDQSIGHSADRSLAPGSSSQLQSSHSNPNQKQQRRHSTGDLDHESFPEEQPHSSNTSRSAMPLNPTVDQLSPQNLPHRPLTAATPSPETSIKLGELNEQLEEKYPQTSGSKMQSLSHLLKARLSLASIRTDRNQDKDDLVEDSSTQDQDRQDHFQGREPLLLNRSPQTSSKGHHELSVSPPMASPSYKQATSHHSEDERAFAYDVHYIEEAPGRSRIQQLSQGRGQAVASLRESGSTRKDQPMSPLPVYSHTMESTLAKPKRKYTKKTSASEAGSGRILMGDIPSVSESELLQSDRGLVLKTQIPKKGRPISKHPSTASQSTPTLSSFGVLPASHPYFSSSKAVSVPFTVSPSILAVNTALSTRNAHVGRPPKLHHIYSSAHDESYHRHLSQVEQQMQTPVRRKPGRPPLASTVARHSHSQSHSSLQSGPFSASPGPLYLTGQRQSSTLHSSRSLYDLTHHPEINRGTVTHNDDEPFAGGASFIHYRDPSPPLSVVSSSTATSSQQGPIKRHSYPQSMENRQHIRNYEYQQQRPSYRLVESPTEIEHRTSRDQKSSSPQEYEREDPSGLVRSFAEGYTTHQVSIGKISSGRKRSSSGATKGPSDRSSTGTSGPQYDDDDRRVISSSFEESEQTFQYDSGSESTRARKRISRPESRGADSGEYDLQDESEYRSTWTSPFPERRGRPRSSTALSMQGRGHESTFMFRERSPVPLRSRNLELELLYTPRKVHIAQDHDSYRQHGGNQALHHGHTHSRSLDLTFVNRRPIATQGRQHHAASEDVMKDRILPPVGGNSLMSPPSISPTFSPIVRIGVGQQRSRQDHFYERYQEPETPLPPTGIGKTTMADMLARQMSSNPTSSRVFTPLSGSSTNRSTLVDSGRGRGAGHVIKTTPKRSIKKGPGPHLKKHQILQQQLHQMQREQEELEIQQALRLRQQQQEQEESIRTKPVSIHQQRSYAKSTAPSSSSQLLHHGEQPPARHQSHPYHPQQPQPGRPPKQRVLMRSESASSVLHSPLSPQYQSYTSTLSQSQSQRPSRPQHSSYASSIGSGRGGGAGGIGSGVSSGNTPSPSSTGGSRQRANQQQTILLRPVSLPMFVGPGGGVVDDSGSPVSITSSSTSSTGRATGQFFHSQGGPPPGQPLYRSLPALSPLSPYQLAPVNMQTSASVSVAPGFGSGLESGGGQIPGSKLSHSRHRMSTEHSSSDDRASTVHPSPRSSPSVSLASPQSVGGTEMRSGPPNSRLDIHGYGSASHYHQQHPPQSQPSYRTRVSSVSVGNFGSASGGGVGHSMSRSTSLSLDAALASKRSGEMSASSSSSTLFHQDTDMSTSSSLTSLSSLSSLATQSHRHSQSSFPTTSFSSSSSFHQEQQQLLQRATPISSSTLSTPYHGNAPLDSPRQNRSLQTIEDMVDSKSMEPPPSSVASHYYHYHPHHQQQQQQHHTLSHTTMAKTASTGRPPLPPVIYPPRSTTPTPASTPTPTFGSRTEE